MGAVTVSVNQDLVRKQIEELVEQKMEYYFILVDVNRLSKMTSMSVSTLERDILSDNRMRVLERRKERNKKYYLWPECLDAIRSIVDDW